MGIINKANLTIPDHEITFHMQHLVNVPLKDNEPTIQICESVEHEDCEEDKSICSSEDNNDGEIACVSSAKVFDNNSWDVECSDDFIELLRVPVICLIEKATQVRAFNCVVLQNPNQDISYLLEIHSLKYAIIEPENLHSFRKLPSVRYGEITTIAKAMNCKILGNFAINLAHNDDWVEVLHDKLFQICGALPTNKKDPKYSKLLSCIKGHYYFRTGTCSLNARLEAKHTAGGTMATKKFEENIIVCVDYEPLLDKQFGVTVKKYSTIEKIIDAGILIIIYFLKKTWGKDYEKACKAKKDADDRALLEAHRLKKQQEAAQAKALKDAEDAAKAQAKALKDAEDAAKAQAKALEDAAKAQEETDDSEDETEEDQSETSSISSQGSRSGSEIEEPKLIQRASSTSILVDKGKLLHCIENWYDENVHMQELETIINFMCKEHQLYKPSVANMVLAILNLEQKIQQLVAEINARYMSDRDPVLCGSDFYNTYKKYFKK
jgi:septum formation inhibitor MinC